MRNDFDLIVKKFSREKKVARLYPVGDIHFGSAEFDLDMWRKWRKIVEEDDDGVVIILGDAFDNALKTSKSNSYDAVMSPMQCKEFAYKELQPIKDKIIGAVRGNHCDRSYQLSGDCPLYDTMCRLQIEDVYRPNFGFLKLTLGERRRDRQFAYSIAFTHGGSRNKTESFGYALDGVDCFLTGHTHQPSVRFPSKIIVDTYNECVRTSDYVQLVIPSFHSLGGYALKGMYMPMSTSKIPIIEFSGIKKEVSVIWN